jgi:hypothetical protein
MGILLEKELIEILIKPPLSPLPTGRQALVKGD